MRGAVVGLAVTRDIFVPPGIAFGDAFPEFDSIENGRFIVTFNFRRSVWRNGNDAPNAPALRIRCAYRRERSGDAIGFQPE